MPSDPLILELVQEVLVSNRSAEEVCADHPELLWEVRKQLKRAQKVEARLAELFPSSIDEPTAHRKPNLVRGSDLPEIPGYKLEEVIGHGGMGVVFSARHLKLNRWIALKMLLAGAFASRQERARFVREAEAVAALSHPHIVQVYDVGEFEGRPFFTMELLQGGSLARRLAGEPQPAIKSAKLVVTLATAVAYAHDHGIVHRDLKPGNILLTADDTPKIADFGLARRVDAAQDLTLSGARLGTPSYMAPEQASGRIGAIGPASDVYALGAILYEMLTGRPPFRADSAAETERQVISEEPVRPSRLNANVPRDLETICLKCLHKEPQRRYASARDLADDLHRYLDGKPILARPVGGFERLVKWTRRRPAVALLVATMFCFAASIIGGGFWLERQRSAQREEQARDEGRASQLLEDALEKVATLAERGSWPAAREVLIGAESHLGEANNPSLQQRIRKARKDADMVTMLEGIRMRVAEHKRNGEILSPGADKSYADAFRSYGIPISDAEPDEAANQILHSEIRDVLLAFIHDWLNAVSGGNRAALEAIVDRADENEWRRAVRKALAANDSERLKALASAPEAGLQPAIVFAGVASALYEKAQGDEVQLLFQKVQRHHSEDFWINFLFGDCLLNDHPKDAVGYLSAAVGIRPDSTHAYMLLGRALLDTGDASGAITAFRMAISLDPAQATAKDVARALATNADLQEARKVWEKVLATNPADHTRWNGYAQLCLYLNNEEAYARAREMLLERPIAADDHWTVAERYALACLLRPTEGSQRQRVLALVDRAVAMAPKFPHLDNAYIQFLIGLSEYRLGRFEQAIPPLEEAAAILPNRPGPRLALAMAQFQAGKPAEARRSLAIGVRGHYWKEQQAKSIMAWFSHVLRREAEAMILPNLPAFLEGKHRPQDNDERMALLGILQFQGRYGIAADLYVDIFADAPDLPDALTVECRLRGVGLQGANQRFEMLNAECRYVAARCAALAGSGLGNDGPAVSEAKKAQWRQQARDWLQADLTAWEKILAHGSENDRELTKRMMTYWEVDPDLVSLRETRALEKLPASEQAQCQQLWDRVRALRERAGQQQAGPANRAAVRATQRAALIEQRTLEEARILWEEDLESGPPEHDAWNSYAELCLFLGREDDYRRARRALLVRFAGTENPFVAERVGRVCMLMPSSGDELGAELALVKKAIIDQPQDDWARPYFAFTRGLAAYRQHHFDEAISLMRGDASRAYGPAPGLVLAMSLQKNGQQREALDTLASAVLEYDWRTYRFSDPGAWTFHVLRREAERNILPHLTDVMEGTYQPQDNAERLALLGICQYQARWGTAARLFAAAFAADPALADRISAERRGRMPIQEGTMDPADVYRSSSVYGAARCALLASSGLGSDAAQLSEAERLAMRKQAIAWLQADLKVWQRLLASDAPADRDMARHMLSRWQAEPDLAGLRETNALEKFSVDEAAACRELWSSVNAALSRFPSAESAK